jgi:hypothetical protein
MSEWAGADGRECGDHRSTGQRSWCFDCTEWCYPESPCRGCELPALRDRLQLCEEVVEVAKRVRALQQEWRRLANAPLGDPASMNVRNYRDKELTAAIREFNAALAATDTPTADTIVG